jgi:hypothetical protein
MYNTLGIEHFALALGKSDNLELFDLSENNLG